MLSIVIVVLSLSVSLFVHNENSKMKDWGAHRGATKTKMTLWALLHTHAAHSAAGAVHIFIVLFLKHQINSQPNPSLGGFGADCLILKPVV